MASINGTPVNFGFTGTNGITITGISGTLLQSATHTKTADCEVTRDGDGDEVAHAWHNQAEEAELVWVSTGTTIADAITNTGASLVAPGAQFQITACASLPNLVATTWEAQSGPRVSKSNTTSASATVPIRKLAGITSFAVS